MKLISKELAGANERESINTERLLRANDVFIDSRTNEFKVMMPAGFPISEDIMAMISHQVHLLVIPRRYSYMSKGKKCYGNNLILENIKVV